VRCAKCGTEFDPQTEECPICRGTNEVKILSQAERENFGGVTLDSEPRDENYYHYESSGPNHRIRIHRVTFGSGGMSIGTKLLIAAIIAVVIFVFLPLALVLIGLGALVWLIRRFMVK
jgi:hypothetical protein